MVTAHKQYKLKKDDYDYVSSLIIMHPIHLANNWLKSTLICYIMEKLKTFKFLFSSWATNQ